MRGSGSGKILVLSSQVRSSVIGGARLGFEQWLGLLYARLIRDFLKWSNRTASLKEFIGF